MNKNYYAVIMAGGIGSRFWPVSQKQFPKQFHDLLGTGETLIQTTHRRLAQIIPEENIFVLTNALYKTLVESELPSITDRQIVLEPAMRNTAPCILLSALKIQKENPNATMIVAPSDHWIEDEEAFAQDVNRAFQACQQDDLLMTLGIQPTFPHTGYGYIEYDDSAESAVKPVNQFREKPDYATAKTFLEQGHYLWNAGIFVWSTRAIINAFKAQLPEMYRLFAAGETAFNTPDEAAFIDATYEEAQNISIDYGIMENASNVVVIPATFDWNDLGSWGSLYDRLEKDEHENVIINANAYLEDTENTIIRTSKDKVVAIKGLKDHIVVENEEILLIYPKSDEQKIKEIRAKVCDKFGDNLG